MQDNNHVLIASTQDLAGATIVNYLKNGMGFTKAVGNSFISLYFENILLHIDDGSLLYLENLDDMYPDAKSFIFLSKHSSDSGIPALTCHCTGNFAGNSYGGNAYEVAIAYPSLQKEYLKAITAIAKHRIPQYDVTIEATHHGPTSLKKPVLFVELGSSVPQWTDTNAARAVCDSLLIVLCSGIKRCREVGIALGGTHYPAKFNKLLLNSEFGLAAVASKHNLQAVDEMMLDQMVAKSIEPVTHIIIDSKGLGRQKEKIMRIAENTRLKIFKL